MLRSCSTLLLCTLCLSLTGKAQDQPSGKTGPRCGVVSRPLHTSRGTVRRPGHNGVFKGKVIRLADATKALDVELDPEAAPQLVLRTDDGKIYSLIHDQGGRTFYRDTALLNRPVQIQARFLPGSHLLQVLQIHTLKEGKPHELYYWCEICSIKRFSLDQQCECCGGPMERREVPVK